MSALVTALLLHVGCPAGTAEVAAPLIAAACEPMRDAPTCAHVAVMLWALETGWHPRKPRNAAWVLRPSSRHACGPLQVVPVRGLTPSCAAMRDPAVGFREGLAMWERKVL